jgi:hypothetical protein
VTAELNIHLNTLSPPPKKKVRRELHKSHIHGTAAIVHPLITENKDKRRKQWCDDQNTWTPDDWQ